MDSTAVMSDVELARIWRQLAFEWKNKLFELYGMNTTDPSFDWNALNRFVRSVTEYYRGYIDRVNVMEVDVHALWDELILLAKVTPAHLPQQDKLVHVVLFSQEQGVIYRWKDGREEEAVTTEGTRLWLDLPFLVSDLKKTWFRSNTELDQIMRHNLAAFTARLCALDVCDDNLAFCALWLLRRTLETPRRVTRPYYRLRRSVVELLPACVVWFQYCGHKLLGLAMDDVSYMDSFYFTEDDVRTTTPGELAFRVGVVQEGFSQLRWLFWKHRFNELCRFEDGEVAIMARYGYEAMNRAERRTLACEDASQIHNHNQNQNRNYNDSPPKEEIYHANPGLLERLKHGVGHHAEDVDSGVCLDWAE